MTESGSQDLVTSPATVKTPSKTPSKTKKVSTSKTKTASKKASPTHPPTAQMVNNAIKSLKDRGGSSLQAIKKYISSTYKVDAEKIAPFIKKYLKSAVDNGSLIRTKGKGASGSFKLTVVKTESTKNIKPKSIKSSTAKKSSTVKKTKTSKKPVITSKSTKPKVAKSTTPKKPSKPKKAKSPVIKKPKSPKSKKIASKKVNKRSAGKK
ncbi:hypothetical protein PGB90_002294 [Kerria lacca]